MKGQPTKWEKIFANPISDKELASKIQGGAKVGLQFFVWKIIQ